MLSINNRHEYAGLIEYDENLQVCNEIFMQSQDDFSAMELKKSFFDYTPINQIKILSQYFN
jgi:hypothetical protein